MHSYRIDTWPGRLQQVLDTAAKRLRRVTVLAETDSTQDAARRLMAEPGDVVVTWRQRAGRGRLGRTWADTAREGIAATFVVTAAQQPERLAVTAAVGTARAAQAFLHDRVGIKWPNDIVVDGRKLAGVLIEQTDDKALIGIGLNVNQRAWPPDLQHRAVSLAQLRGAVDRLEVLEALLLAIDESLGLSDDALAAEFAARDRLRGATATFRRGRQTVTGVVSRVDPLRGLVVETIGGERYLPAAATTLVSAEYESP